MNDWERRDWERRSWERKDSDYMPDRYKPITAWGYVGYSILFAIPIIGFVFAIVYAFNNDNVNRRNFARSQFCIFLVLIIIGIIVGGIWGIILLNMIA